jgi:EspG family
VLRGRIGLSLDTLNTVLRWEKVDEAHTVLAATPVWRDDEAQREANQRAWAELTQQGLTVARQLEPGFRGTLIALMRPAVEFFGWISTPNGTIGVLVAASGNESVLVVRADQMAWLHPTRPDTLAEAVVAQLPTVPAAAGRSLNVPEASLTARGGRHGHGDDEGFSGFGSQDGPTPDVKLLTALMAEPRVGGGQLYAAVRDGLDRRCKAPHALSYLDVAPGRSGQGRWMTQLTPSSSGENWVFVAPATPQALTTKLYEMYRVLG